MKYTYTCVCVCVCVCMCALLCILPFVKAVSGRDDPTWSDEGTSTHESSAIKDGRCPWLFLDGCDRTPHNLITLLHSFPACILWTHKHTPTSQVIEVHPEILGLLPPPMTLSPPHPLITNNIVLYCMTWAILFHCHCGQLTSVHSRRWRSVRNRCGDRRI